MHLLAFPRPSHGGRKGQLRPGKSRWSSPRSTSHLGIGKIIGFNVSALKEEAELRPAEKRRASKRERESGRERLEAGVVQSRRGGG